MTLKRYETKNVLFVILDYTPIQLAHTLFSVFVVVLLTDIRSLVRDNGQHSKRIIVNIFRADVVLTLIVENTSAYTITAQVAQAHSVYNMG